MIKPVPHRLQKRITEAGGLAPTGVPLFRVMRSCDVFAWVGGPWKHYDAHGNCTGSHIGLERVPKYPNIVDRYIMQVWCPPENYGSEAKWKETFTECFDGQFINTMGPFPREGDYELLTRHGVIERLTLDKAGNVIKREFVPLTDSICTAIVDVAKLNRELPEKVRIEAVKAEREKQEKEKDQRLIDQINDMHPAFGGKSHVVVPTSKETALYG